ncbi:MAG TPA: hypothetical protein VK705_06595 [Ferruginibacter sp.]|jgi:hypothetical protein|nr:hypothetical protein [Ferruginibacter sp.]
MRKTQNLYTTWEIKAKLLKEELLKDVKSEYFNMEGILREMRILDYEYFPVLEYRKLKYFKTVMRRNPQIADWVKFTVATEAGLQWLIETKLETINELYKNIWEWEKKRLEERERRFEENHNKNLEHRKRLQEEREARGEV